MYFELSDDIYFPDPRLILGEYQSETLYALGGDYQPKRLLEAARWGIFPWSPFRSQVKSWHCPADRFVIFPNEIHISHSMRQLIKKGIYRLSVDEDFEGVINGCAEFRIESDGAWLGGDLIDSVIELHKQGFAHSIEVWDGEKLVGGLYGELVDGIFFGESMFSRVPSGSKLALIHLAKLMQEKGYLLIDCQMPTDHLKSMGGRTISYSEYLKLKGIGDGPTALRPQQLSWLNPKVQVFDTQLNPVRSSKSFINFLTYCEFDIQLLNNEYINNLEGRDREFANYLRQNLLVFISEKIKKQAPVEFVEIEKAESEEESLIWVSKSWDELTTLDLYDILKLRSEVFVNEQNCPYQDIDDKDQKSLHLMCLATDGNLAAYLRIIPNGVESDTEGSIGRVIVRKQYRGKGLGHKLINRGIEIYKHEVGCKYPIVIHAQSQLENFYSKHNFVAISEPFMFEGLLHTMMKLEF